MKEGNSVGRVNDCCENGVGLIERKFAYELLAKYLTFD